MDWTSFGLKLSTYASDFFQAFFINLFFGMQCSHRNVPTVTAAGEQISSCFGSLCDVEDEVRSLRDDP